MNVIDKSTALDSTLIEKRALSMRKDAAEYILESNKNWIPKDYANSHYDVYRGKLPFPSGDDAFSFNDLVTTTALSKFVLPLKDPYEIAYLGAKIVEQTYYQFFDPIQPSDPIKNLSIAKHFGTFFTPPDIANLMVNGLIGGNKKTSLLDPCLGSGSLLCAALLRSNELPYNQLYGVELDQQIANWARDILVRVAKLVGYQGEIIIIQGDGLDSLLSEDQLNTSSSKDIIINPPFGRLRVTQDRATNAETSFRVEAQEGAGGTDTLNSHHQDYGSEMASRYPILKQDSGILERSKMFLRACYTNVKNGSRVAFIGPDSWMSGRDSKDIRKALLDDKFIDNIILIEEGRRTFKTVNQATAIVILNNNEKEMFSITSGSKERERVEFVDYSHLGKSKRGYIAIPKISGQKMMLFNKLSDLPTIGSKKWITNARGEVDQTAQKALFLEMDTPVKFVRGVHVEPFFLNHYSTEKRPSYLDEEGHKSFIDGKPKESHFVRERIVGRQCSYAQQERRLIFCLVPARHAIGNSCNYLSINSEGDNRNISYLLLGILNSRVLDWFFRIENSNNHVANYEIDLFPFPTNDQYFPLISILSFQMAEAGKSKNKSRTDRISMLLEAVVGLAYGLDPISDLKHVLEGKDSKSISIILNYAAHIDRKLRIPIPNIGSLFFNHEAPTLSALDDEIISHVPEGGNWQNIPDTVPSARLVQIREMTAERGVVRTTYYGRLRRDQPAYTINTYFNRPGNGTHIHPSQDRTLTSREAARLQSFPDGFLFSGSQGAIRNQIGNAVPPLLAKAIGEKLLNNTTSHQCLDVFCGAGGYSLGLEKAGWDVICAVDNDQDALDTYCMNHLSDFEPDHIRSGFTGAYKRDLHDSGAFEDICEKVERYLGGRPLDLLVGGPPCQGFSHAGFRMTDDKRNDLASIFIHFAERLKPQILMLENVEGLLTMKKGQVLSDIISTLKSLGYNVFEPTWKLLAEQYGVPQMRRRVFVVASLDPAMDLTPPLPSRDKCSGRRAPNPTRSFLDDKLPKYFSVAEAFSGLSMDELDTPTLLTDWYDSL